MWMVTIGQAMGVLFLLSAEQAQFTLTTKKKGLRYTKSRKDNVEFWRAGWVADFLAVLLKAPFAATCNPPNVP